VELLARLHLTGFFWGDCSLSNTLFRYDAGTLEAYLVDAETSELHEEGLTNGQREYDVELATERVYGELLDLQAAELLPDTVDPDVIADELNNRYTHLWHELTREELLRPEDQRYLIADRLRSLNALGFDAEEIEIVPTPEGNKLKVRTRVAEQGQDTRRLFLRTGIEAGENQARRLLNDIASFRAYLEQKSGHPVSEVVAANGWLEEVYDPVINAIPGELKDRLAPAEIFHEILEHRWYLSEQAGRDIGTTAAARSYFEQVLPQAPAGDSISTGDFPRSGRPLAAFRRPAPLRSVSGMEITAAAAHHSPSAASHVLAYFLLALLVFVVFAGVASIFSSRWRHIAVPAIAVSVGGLISLYLVGRAIAEFFVVNYSDPASYRNDWGGPSLAGVFAVHAGPGIAIVIAAIVGLYRRHHHRGAVCPA
jgi:hypothetical protein